MKVGEGSSTDTGRLSAPEYLSSIIKEYREELTNSGFSEDKFVNCLMKVVVDNSEQHRPRNSQKKRMCTCTFVIKSLWLAFLGLLAFCLLVAGFKPLSFLVQKWIHAKLYYVVLRPLRIIVAAVIPYLAMLHLDFLNTDCLLPNPLRVGLDGCPCFNIKHPVEIVSNHSQIPAYLLEPGVLDVYVLKNYTLLDTKFSIATLVDFPSLHDGIKPLSCMEMAFEDAPLYVSYEFYDHKKVYKALSSKKSWSFAWLECPQKENLFTLHEVIPPLSPPITVSANSTFTVSTKWSQFSDLLEFLPDASMIIIRVLVGHVRFVMEARNEACFEHCTKFKDNPVLQPGDALVFDHRVWNFGAIAWADVTFLATEVLATL